jgi:hypothetical protein
VGLSPPGLPCLPGVCGVFGAGWGSGLSTVGLPGSVAVGAPGFSPGDPGLGGSGESAYAPAARKPAVMAAMILILVLCFMSIRSSLAPTKAGVFQLKMASLFSASRDLAESKMIDTVLQVVLRKAPPAF